MTLKDQPIDVPEFERLWDEVEYHWRLVERFENHQSHDTLEDYYDSRDNLRAIKHRFFNNLQT